MDNLYNTVIKNDYCIGCGACNFVNPEYKIGLDEFGMFKAHVQNQNIKADDPALQVCPFSDLSKNEDFIADRQFKNVNLHNPYIGRYISNFVGHVNEGDFRVKGSSGGFGKWILNELLQTNEVDYVIQVVSNSEEGKLFDFEIFTQNDNILEGSKSAYYPVTLKDALFFIKENKGRYAITAVPCFSKAIRNICMNDPVMADRVKYIIGIICGHLKSTGFAESLGWQLDVKPQELRGIEFRGKIEGLNANEKGVYATDLNGEKSRTASSKKLFGGDWGYGFFKYKACDYCDDVVGETADVSVGDAWIKELMSDHKGNNVVIIRNQRIAQIVNKAIIDKRLNFTEVNDEVVVKSQEGGIRHRREGLSYRLHTKKKKKEWAPVKRVAPSSSLSSDRKRIYKIREEMRDASHTVFRTAKQLNSFSFFENSMKCQTRKLEYIPFIIKIKVKLGRLKKALLK